MIKSNFLQNLNKLKNFDRDIPILVGAEAVRFSKERFTQGNWIDINTVPWKKRKVQRGSRKRNQRGTLIDSGKLFRSIRVIEKNMNYVVIGTDVAYAQAHNEGFNDTVQVPAHKRGQFSKSKAGTGIFSIRTRKERTKTVIAKTGESTVKAHSKKLNLPKRQFIGNSFYLSKNIERVVLAYFINKLK